MSRLRVTWYSMIARCTKENSSGYANYGGRGITVCERWLNFQNFKEDMEESYMKHREENGMTAERINTTLDRVDNEKGYSPENCRWSTYLEQRHNQRKHKRVYQKRTKKITPETLQKFADGLGLKVEELL